MPCSRKSAADYALPAGRPTPSPVSEATISRSCSRIDASSAQHVADHLEAVLQVSHTHGGKQLVVHASIGIALDDASTNAQDLLRHADHAMYQAKNDNKRRLQPRS